MLAPLILFAFSHIASANAQHAGDQVIPEVHPKITIQQCTAPRSCQTLQREIVLDANWRWLREAATPNGYNNCIGIYSIWYTRLCPNPTECAKNCALEGAQYIGVLFSKVKMQGLTLRFVCSDSYSVTTSGDSLTLKFITLLQFAKVREGNSAFSEE